MNLVLLAAATVWWSIALSVKDGPFGNPDSAEPDGLFVWFRAFVSKYWRKHPFTCAFCTSPYVLVVLLLIQTIFPQFITFFGILGFAAVMRGMTQEYA